MIQTPTLDSLARSGIRFTNAYAECPVCIPARRTLMTGTSPRSHGDRVAEEKPMPELPTLAQTFREAGYQAYAVGQLDVYPSVTGSVSTMSSSTRRAGPSMGSSTTTRRFWPTKATPDSNSSTA